jgi:hypothetical protein
LRKEKALFWEEKESGYLSVKMVDAKTAKPAEMWTTMPPAESRMPQALKKPYGLQTQCANGQ